MYIIQTNISLNPNYKEEKGLDFQNMIHKIYNVNWEELKNIILENKYNTKTKCTMLNFDGIGSLTPKNYKIEKININDDLHLEIIINHGNKYEFRTKVQYYLIKEDDFKRIL